MPNKPDSDLATRVAESDPTLFAEVLEAVSEAIVIYDADGRLVTCNRAFRDLYGYSEAEARPGVHFQELGRIDVEHGVVAVGDEFGDGGAYLARKAEYRRRLEGSFIVRLKDGRWIKTTDRPMRRGGFVSVQVDITEIKRNELATRRAMEAAENAARTKTDFLANISHDLRTPLNAIIGFSEMMLSEVSGPIGNDAYRDYIENIHKGGGLLLSIVNDILDTAKLDSGKYMLTPEVLDPAALSQEVIAGILPLTGEKGLSVTAHVAEGVPDAIRTDRRALIQILNNLLSNACRHVSTGGKVRVEWDVPAPDRVALSVVDDGAGMSAELVERIGEPFLQDGSATATSGERGTGLGIYICTRLAEALGATFDVDSAPDAGTRVTLTWPAGRLAPNRSIDPAFHRS